MLILPLSLLSYSHAFAKSRFTDLAEIGSQECISTGTAIGILRGYPDGTVRPEEVVTRAEMMAMASRAFGEELNSEVAGRLLPIFTDVPSEHWAAGYIRACYELGLIAGDERGLVWPDRKITRTELAVVLARLMRITNAPVTSEKPVVYTDWQDVPDWAIDNVKSITQAGLLVGTDGRFRPNDGATRYEVVSTLIRLLDVLGSRWDVTGSVISVDLEVGIITVQGASSEAIPVKIADGTEIFSQSKLINVSIIVRGSTVGVIFDKAKSGAATVICLL